MANRSAISEIFTNRLSAEKIDQAYPLVRELRDDLTLEAWRGYAETYLGPATMRRWKRRTITATGIVATTAAARISPHGT